MKRQMTWKRRTIDKRILWWILDIILTVFIYLLYLIGWFEYTGWWTTYYGILQTVPTFLASHKCQINPIHFHWLKNLNPSFLFIWTNFSLQDQIRTIQPNIKVGLEECLQFSKGATCYHRGFSCGQAKIHRRLLSSILSTFQHISWFQRVYFDGWRKAKRDVHSLCEF